MTSSVISKWHLPLRALLVINVLAGASIVHGKAEAPQEEAKGEEIAEGVEVTLKLDLGNIELKNLEPTQGRTAHMSFDLHLMFGPTTEPKQVKELEQWLHRLREQVIVAVRATEINDFLDPELKRFRKQILYRINRMLKSPTVINVLFANFTFSSQ